MKKTIAFDDFNSVFPAPDKQGVVGSITTQFGNPAPRHGWKLIEYEDEQDKYGPSNRS